MLNLIKKKIEYFRKHWFVKNPLFFQVGDFAANFTQADKFSWEKVASETLEVYKSAIS